MAKRGTASGTTSMTPAARTGADAAAAGAPATVATEQRLIAFAEQLGQFAGNLQAKAGHLLDGEALTTQMSTLRESAADLLAHLTAGAKQVSVRAARAVGRTSPAGASGKKRALAAKGSGKKSAKSSAAKRGAPAAGTSGAGSRGRSGGVVDAPGKKRRAPLPKDPHAAQARSQTAKMRMAMPMEKTSRRRGRG